MFRPSVKARKGVHFDGSPIKDIDAADAADGAVLVQLEEADGQVSVAFSSCGHNFTHSFNLSAQETWAVVSAGHINAEAFVLVDGALASGAWAAALLFSS